MLFERLENTFKLSSSLLHGEWEPSMGPFWLHCRVHVPTTIGIEPNINFQVDPNDLVIDLKVVAAIVG